MNTKELILHDNTDIKALFMDNNVRQILITSDLSFYNANEITQETFENGCWDEVVEFGIKNIVVKCLGSYELTEYDSITAVVVREWDCTEYEEDIIVQTFINANCKVIQNLKF